jgi:hypothetical protein
MSLVPLLCLALCLPAAAWAPAVLAQDASPEAVPTEGIEIEPVESPTPFCDVLTPEEASAAFGVTLTYGSSSDTDCSWDADFVTSDISLIAARDIGDLELDAQAIFPDGVTLDVGGHAAWYAPDDLVMFVDVGDGLLFTLEVYGTPAEGLDLQAALSDLAALAVPRLAAIAVPPEPSEVPEPTFEGDPVLQALFPDAVGDAPMEVEVFSGSDILAGADTEDPEAQAMIADLQALLSAHGKTFDDVSIAEGYFETEDAAVGDVIATRVAGTDITDFEDELIAYWLPYEDPQRTPMTIAGREVTAVTDGPPATGSPDPSADPFALPLPPSYVYAAGDVLFIVSADEPELSQLLELLPAP